MVKILQTRAKIALIFSVLSPNMDNLKVALLRFAPNPMAPISLPQVTAEEHLLQALLEGYANIGIVSDEAPVKDSVIKESLTTRINYNHGVKYTFDI